MQSMELPEFREIATGNLVQVVASRQVMVFAPDDARAYEEMVDVVFAFIAGDEGSALDPNGESLVDSLKDHLGSPVAQIVIHAQTPAP
jgi:hypothetical protein